MRRRRVTFVLAIAFAGALALWGVTSILSYRSIDALVDTADLSARAHRASMELERGFSEVKDAEAAVRGYLLTSEAQFLKDHQPAAERARQSLARLREASHAELPIARWIAELERLVSERLSVLAETLAAAPRGRDVVAPWVIRGKERMLALRQFVAARRTELGDDVIRREREAREGAERAVRADALGTLVGLGLALSAFVALLLEARRRSSAEEIARNLSLIDDLTGLYNRRGPRWWGAPSSTPGGGAPSSSCDVVPRCERLSQGARADGRRVDIAIAHPERERAARREVRDGGERGAIGTPRHTEAALQGGEWRQCVEPPRECRHRCPTCVHETAGRHGQRARRERRALARLVEADVHRAHEAAAVRREFE